MVGWRLPALAVVPFYVETFVKLLAVVGGAAIGWLVIGFLVRRLGKVFLYRDVPRPAMLLVRSLGAVATGLLVWTMVFAPGGSGLFGGGGSLFGEKRTGTGKENPPAAMAKGTETASPAVDSVQRRTLRVTILGGQRVVDERFYLVEGDKEPQTLAQLKTIIRERQQASGLEAVELLIYENSVARNHPAVRDLEQWAKQQNLTVSLPPTKGEIP
jgi:hypothetical protein